MTVLDSIRRIVAEDAAHEGTTHELYLRRETVDDIEHTMMGHMTAWGGSRRNPPTLLGLPLRILPRDSTRRDCIATIRRGQVISVTNL